MLRPLSTLSRAITIALMSPAIAAAALGAIPAPAADASAGEQLVKPFRTYFVGFTRTGAQLRLTGVVVIDTTPGETVEVRCQGCSGPRVLGPVRAHGRQMTIDPHGLVVDAASQMTVTVSALTKVGRFKTYSIDPVRGDESLRREGCLVLGGTRPVSCAKAMPRSELWSTIDICGPSDQPDVVGVRASMPADGERDDLLAMRFTLQIKLQAGGWSDLPGATSPYVIVGNGLASHQTGWSFQLSPASAAPTTLRGKVEFQWSKLQGARTVQEATLFTGAAPAPVADADPAGYSAATCVFG